ncbi:MAG: hypothetical protein EOP86_26270 [Verrucomicrobiaceae bacterium]|nr:MAG: hypothetical protein EOP86_26270 [Verrucomicrobiaceae bacterium]
MRICDEDPELRVKLIGVWATHHPEAAMSYAEERLAASPGEFDRSVYLWPWMERDPAEAAKWFDANAETKPAIYERANSRHGGFSEWAVQQMLPGEAVELTVGLNDPVVRNSFVTAMYNEYAARQPEVLAGLAPVMQLPDDARPLSVSRFLNAWRRTDEKAASGWVGSLPEGELKATAQRSLSCRSACRMGNPIPHAGVAPCGRRPRRGPACARARRGIPRKMGCVAGCARPVDAYP